MRVGMRESASDADTCSARDAALQLLRHSVKLGHPRLVVVRLLDAAKLGAPIDDELWDALARLRNVAADPARRATLLALCAAQRRGPEYS
ncbi:hypothetical protein [Burkholderia sp. PU8-34]